MKKVSHGDVFDREPICDEVISPLVSEITQACHEHGIPMFATFLYARDEGGKEDYCTSSIPGCERTEEFARRIHGDEPPPDLAVVVTTGKG